MLYDNAQLARVYLHAYQITGNEYYKRITTEILDYVIREMTDANGGFYSSQDADSEGEEGKFFVWTPEEIRTVLGGGASGLLIVSKTKSNEANDAALFMDSYGVTERGNFEGKNILNLAEGLLALYETTFDVTFFSAARELANQILEHFTDPRGGFFDASDDHESLVVRPKDVQDNATPSGGAMATLVLFKLAAYTGHPGYVDAAEAAVAPLQPALAQAPTGFAWL